MFGMFTGEGIMEERNVIVRESGRAVATGSLVAVIAIAVLIALFVWQPWNTTSHGGGSASINTGGTATSGSAH
jgi:hypothetical protein